MPLLAAILGLTLVLPSPTLASAPVPAVAEARHAPLAASVDVRVPASRWGAPLPGTLRIVRAFDPPALPYLPGHRGVDLAGASGEAVLAAGAGTVVFAGMIAGRGVVSVEHPGGLRTTYEPVTATVRAGDAVGLGTRLGSLDPGHPGCPVAACLHWGLRRGMVYLDPLQLLRPLHVRLKPLDG
ncbi:MAG TPA: peptidoglycan DD-metalloendopeptidase family protein [Micromonosporaceae bacterium]|jgi:murein DD-endopeptidase MepM/ murein hydrolase activator NlpD